MSGEVTLLCSACDFSENFEGSPQDFDDPVCPDCGRPTLHLETSDGEDIDLDD